MKNLRRRLVFCASIAIAAIPLLSGFYSDKEIHDVLSPNDGIILYKA